MSLQQLRKEIQELKVAAEVKKALPWDCKNLMSRYKEERARREILCKFYDITGVAYEAPGPYRLEVENQRDLSREAREFLSLSAEKQARPLILIFLRKYTLRTRKKRREGKLLKILTGVEALKS